jgi:DNA-binding MarR family transcriptional regulator
MSTPITDDFAGVISHATALLSAVNEQTAFLDAGVSVSGWLVLRRLARKDEAVGMPALTRGLSQSRQRTQKIVTKLQKKGLVASTVDEGDKRVRMVQITDAGSKALKSVESALAAALDASMGDAPDKAQQKSRNVLRKLVAGFRSDAAKAA